MSDIVQCFEFLVEFLSISYSSIFFILNIMDIQWYVADNKMLNKYGSLHDIIEVLGAPTRQCLKQFENFVYQVCPTQLNQCYDDNKFLFDFYAYVILIS